MKWLPSVSTVGSGGLGVPAVIVIVWILSLYKIDMPMSVAASLGVVISTAIGYFFKGGKSGDTK